MAKKESHFKAAGANPCNFIATVVMRNEEARKIHQFPFLSYFSPSFSPSFSFSYSQVTIQYGEATSRTLQCPGNGVVCGGYG